MNKLKHIAIGTQQPISKPDGANAWWIGL
ncbi:MAG: hypothetical protein RLZZ117_473, partial [Cyanobacteriota bacterium]